MRRAAETRSTPGWSGCCEQNYAELRKQPRGLVRAYVENDRDERVQTTRLIRSFLDQGVVQMAPYQRHSFAARHTHEDVALLEEVDRAHERLSGPATRRILEREYEQFGNRQYQRLAKISVSHRYNLRASARYRNQAAVFEPTRPAGIAIGERRKPDPQGRPDFCVWIRCTRGTGMGPRACTTSTRQMQ